MQYHIHTAPTPNFSRAENAVIGCYVWPGFDTYRPETNVRLLCVDGKGLALQMFCRESAPKAVYSQFFDPVYKDSCMEFFFSFEKGGRYVNCEMNARGAALMAVGPDRFDRTRLDALVTPPAVRPLRTDNGWWGVEVFFPLETLRTLFGDVSLTPGTVLYGNFYKCGDETEIEHYGMWSPVGTEKPDFHRPEFFGELVID